VIEQEVQILMVDDDPVDVELTLEVLQTSKLKMNINVVMDGVEAMEYLLRKGKYSASLKPDLILLDLNMPRKDGRETLQEIKTYDNLKDIPVIILTASKGEEDIVDSYSVGASCYITKPVGIAEFKKVVSSIEDFWFTIAKLPANSK
jgi:two-component system, chemotaxis family, response regulator Rcp1